ncbi:MAG TPA: type II secretion system F family protein [Pedomonas sp.]|uniref:type II secretion system F family protein n=1 Tax=Pedomonas sp. TaxID=2976421 RepID=UPI002F413981
MGGSAQWTIALPAVLFLIFLSVVLLVTGLGSAISSRARMRQRLVLPPALARPGGNFWAGLVAALQRRGILLEDEHAASLRSRLSAAGFHRPEAPALYTLVRIVLSLGLPGLFLSLNAAAPGAAASRLYLVAAALALAGLYLPRLWVDVRAARRRQAMLSGLPDTLDLVLVCVEAGLGVDAAFQRVGAEIVQAHPLLARHLAAVTLEMRAGRSRAEALRRMGERSGVPEIRAFATLVVQSEKLGSSMAQALRTYAAEMREHRRLRAEEKAHRLPVLLSVPLVACMLPTMVGILMLPAAIRVMRDLMPALGQ